MARAGEPIEKRLWSRVVITTSGCHEFAGSRTKAGHGQIHYNGRNRRTHTVAFELTFGSIPEGAQINHHCDNPPCVNPDHLYAGDQVQNMADMNRRGRNVKGSRTGTAKLCEAQALEVFMATGTHREIGQKYGISRHSVGLIKKGINWRWLTDGLR